MRFFSEFLNNYYPIKGGTLQCYILDNPWDNNDCARETWQRPAIIIAPGGAYRFTSHREGEIVASEFLAQGFQCFVLEYLCRPQGAFYPEQLFELSCAVDFVRKNAASYNINKDKIFTLGFSAGGHLVANQSNEYPSVSSRLGVSLDCKPTAVGLSYPVINNHDDSFDNLLFGYYEPDKTDLKNFLKVDQLVSVDTPPTFIWTTTEDNLVSPINSISYSIKLSEKKVPFELHVYPRGGHGKSIGTKEINGENDAVSSFEEWACLRSWIKDCSRFFKSICG